MSRAFRFGVVTSAPTRAGFVEAARKAEALGYSVLLANDHLDVRHGTHLMPIPALAAAAIVTSEIRLGTSVLNHDLRHPAVLARDLSALDVLSEGRLEIGLGTGWVEREYQWAGIRFDSGGTRVERLAEYVQVVKGILEAEDSFSFEGKWFRIEEMPGSPRPLQRPRPPLLLGGQRPRLLSLAAREAEIVSILMLQTRGTTAELEQRVGWVRDAAGRRFPKLELNLTLAAVLPTDGDPIDAVREAIPSRHFLQRLSQHAAPEEIAVSPAVLVGSPASMAERLHELRERFGISYLLVPGHDLDALAPVIARC